MTEKITDNVYLVGGSDLTDPADCLIYLVRLGKHAALIDTGVGQALDVLIGNIESAGVALKDLRTIILTHCHVDHIGGTNELRRRTSAKVYAHEKDARAIEEAIPAFTVERYYGVRLEPIPVDARLSGDSGEFDFAPEELSWVHTPGHTPGSIAVLYKTPDGEKILFGQDIHGPFEPSFGSDINQWRVSMKKLLDLAPDVLCEGHFGIFQPAEKVRAFIESHLLRHQ